MELLLTELELKNEELFTSQSDKNQLRQEKDKLEARLINLQTKYEELIEQVNNRQVLLKESGEKKTALEELKKNCKYGQHQKLLVEILLKTEENINLYNTHDDHEMKEKIITDLNKFDFREAENICQLQANIINIDKELENIRQQASTIIDELMKLTKGQFFLHGKKQNLILFGDINTGNISADGNVFIGNQISDANFSYTNNLITELSKEKRLRRDS